LEISLDRGRQPTGCQPCTSESMMSFDPMSMPLGKFP